MFFGVFFRDDFKNLESIYFYTYFYGSADGDNAASYRFMEKITKVCQGELRPAEKVEVDMTKAVYITALQLCQEHILC